MPVKLTPLSHTRTKGINIPLIQGRMGKKAVSKMLEKARSMKERGRTGILDSFFLVFFYSVYR